MSDYFFDPEHRAERNRLRRLEEFFDPFTHASIESLSIRPGWKCLEVGAGGGSIAEWLAWRVGPTGRVVATDLNTLYLDQLRAPNLEVRRHEIGQDLLEEEFFDLIHARAVLEHIPDRISILEQMRKACRPGGWVLIESADFASVAPMNPDHDVLFKEVFDSLQGLLVARGFSTDAGRRVGAEIRQLGFESVSVDGRIFEWGGELPLTHFYLQTFQRLGSIALESGTVDRDKFDRFLSMVTEPSFRALSHITCVARGRRPNS